MSKIINIFVIAFSFAGQSQAAGPRDFRPPKNGGVYVIAHRGAHVGIPENTLAAYRKAIELGADFVEIDVRTTKDGRFVSIHNRSVDAYVTDGTKGKVGDFTLAELKAMDIGSRVDSKWKNERIPTFEEILDLCKGKIGIYLDLKDAPIAELVKLIRQRNMQREIVWYLSPGEAKQLATECPECIPMPDPGAEKNLPRVLKEIRPSILAPGWRNFSDTYAQKCHAIGAIVFVDESNRSSWEPAIRWGVDGIQTNDPQGLITFLKEHAKKTR